VRAAILPTLNPVEQETVKYVELLKDQVGTYPAPAPLGSQEFDQNVMRPVADQLAFGKITVAEAAQKLVEEGALKLKRKS
jgi:multiple sugar transport system substrate-binding protein